MSQQLRTVSYLLTFFFYLISIPYPQFNVMLISFSIASLVLSVVPMRGLTLFTSLLFLLLGTAISLIHGKHMSEVWVHFSGMSGIVTLLGLIPLLGVPVQVSGYAASIESMARSRIQNANQFSSVTRLLGYGIGSITNLAAIPMISALVNGLATQMNIPQRIISTSLLQGFIMSMLWSPLGIAFTTLIDLTGASLLIVIVCCIGLSFAGLLLSRMLLRKETSKLTVNREASHSNREPISSQFIVKMTLPILFFVICVVVAHEWLHISLIYLLSLSAVPFSYVWSVLLKKRAEYVRSFVGHVQIKLSEMYNLFGLLISAGFFAGVLQSSPYVVDITNALAWFAHHTSTSMLVIGCMLFVILLSVIGVHHIVAATIVTQLIDPLIFGIPLYLWASALSAAMCIGALASPFNATTSLMAASIESNSFQIARWNMPFNIFFFIFVSVIIIIIL